MRASRAGVSVVASWPACLLNSPASRSSRNRLLQRLINASLQSSLSRIAAQVWFAFSNNISRARDESKPHTLADSPESIATTALDTAPLEPGAPQPSATAQAGPPSQQLTNTRLSALLDFARKFRHLSFAEISAFVKRIRRLSLNAAGAVFGLIALFVSVEQTVAWYRDVRERRHELAVDTVTPERLIARCGAAEQDVSSLSRPPAHYELSRPRQPHIGPRLQQDRRGKKRLGIFVHEGRKRIQLRHTRRENRPCHDSTK